MTGPVRILMVCTGNICRSPVAELLLRDRLARDGIGPDQVVVAGAGTYAGHAGEPMQAGSAAVLRVRGIDPTGFRASALSAAAIDRADLILTAEPSHRERVLALVPTAATTTFPVLQAAALAQGVPPAPTGVAGLVHGWAEAARSGAGASRDDDAVVADPYGLPQSAFDAMAVILEQALDPIAERLVHALAAEGRRPGSP